MPTLAGFKAECVNTYARVQGTAPPPPFTLVGKNAFGARIDTDLDGSFQDVFFDRDALVLDAVSDGGTQLVLVEVAAAVSVTLVELRLPRIIINILETHGAAVCGAVWSNHREIHTRSSWT